MKEITPFRTYPLKIYSNARGKRIGVEATSTIKKVQRAVYMFMSLSTRKCLVGVTKNLQKRVYNYNSDINGRKKNNSFLNAVRKNPKDFNFSILEPLKPSANLQEKEKYYIQMLDSVKKGYNKNRGGGGAFATTQIPSDTPVVYDTPQFITPEKKYPIVRGDDGNLKVEFDGTPTKAKRKLIYSLFEDDPTPSSPSKLRRHQIGFTTQVFSRRMSQHMSIVNNENHPEASRHIYKSIRENPERFSVVLMHLARPGEDLADLEKAAISLKKHKFNHNKGGGGASKNS